jgi:acyl-coenzyme A synthetase/AMP-(fatty) acid ligase
MTAATAAFSDREIRGHLKRIVSGPRDPKREFLLSGYTYGEVYGMASGLLSSFSAGPADTGPVCLCAQNRAVVAAALLASFAGGPLLILPYSDSPQVLAEMGTSTGFRAAIADRRGGFITGVETVFPEECRGIVSDLTRHGPLDPDSVVLRLYTGGSTGRPKTWSKTLRNLLAEAVYLSEKFDISHRDRFVATISPLHIYGLLFSVLVPFVSSASVRNEGCSFPSEIASVMEDSSPTVFVSVPMHYRVLRGQRISAPSLRAAFSSAGVLDGGDGEAFFRQTGVGVVEVFGSTETGGIASRCSARGETAFTPLEGIAWRIVDERLQIRSDFVSPEVERGADGFFATADRATPHNDGGFLLAGRSDSVIKVGGKRVDLEEVRSKLNGLSGVRDSIVISVPVNGGRENAIAALVEGDLDGERVRLVLSHILEPYALPRRIKVVDRMPCTAAGKYGRMAVEEVFRKEGLL